ncbi:MAG: SRPBCC family protein [Magnetospiraceae bacterium]
MADATHDLALSRTLDAPREHLWRCWVEPDLLNKWFCPKPWFVSETRIDLRPGGEFFTLMNGPDGEQFPNKGVFLEILEFQRLVFTDAFQPGWRPAGRPFMVADVQFSDAEDGGTAYTATARHWTAECRQEHETMGFHEGWNKAADQLVELAKTL